MVCLEIWLWDMEVDRKGNVGCKGVDGRIGFWGGRGKETIDGCSCATSAMDSLLCPGGGWMVEGFVFGGLDQVLEIIFLLSFTSSCSLLFLPFLIFWLG